MRRTRSIMLASVSLLLATSPQAGTAGPAPDCAPAAFAAGSANVAVERGAVAQEGSARGTAPNQSDKHYIFSITTGDTTHQPGSSYCGRGRCEAPGAATASNPNVQVGLIENRTANVATTPSQVAAHRSPSRLPPDPTGPIHLPGSKYSEDRAAAASGNTDVRAGVGAVASGASTSRAVGPDQAGRHRIFSGTTGDTVHLPGSRYCRGSCDAPTVAVGTSSTAGLKGSYQVSKEALSAAAAADAAAKDKCQVAPSAKK